MSRTVLEVTIIEIDLVDAARRVLKGIQERDPAVCDPLVRMGIDPADPDLETVEGVCGMLVALAELAAEEQGRGA